MGANSSFQSSLYEEDLGLDYLMRKYTLSPLEQNK